VATANITFPDVSKPVKATLAAKRYDGLLPATEAAALMDGLVDYAASDGFSPKSRMEMATLPTLNGWGKTVRAGDATESPHDVMEGYARRHGRRQEFPPLVRRDGTIRLFH
jgi:hypothetical protein